MKTKKISLKLIILAILVMAGSLFVPSKAYAAENEGDINTALAKLYYRSVYVCIRESRQGKKTVNTDKVANGDIFADNHQNVQVGSLIEGRMYGDTDKGLHGIIECDDNDSLIFKKAVEQFQKLNKGISKEDIICDGEKAGIMHPNKIIEPSCSAFLSSKAEEMDYSTSLQANGQAEDYFAKVVREKVFNGNVPGGDLGKFTEFEDYLIKLNTFQSVCTEQKANGIQTDDESEHFYNIKQYQSGEWKNYGYDKNSKFDDEKNNFPLYTKKATDNTDAVTIDCNKLQKELNNLAADDKIAEVVKKEIDKGKATDGTYQDEIEDQCKQNGVTGLAWLLCPIVSLVKNAMEWLYEEAVEPFLQVDAKIFDRENELYNSWNTFRGFANIVLIIFLLIVIFSQLTGFGIDNYGIKKSLPKLITTALLINLSYFICQGAVDLSNLLGYGFFRLFEGMVHIPAQAVTNAGTGTSVAAGSAILGTVTVAAGLISGGTVFASLGTALVAALPGMLMGLISGLISILFFFLILGARQGGIIVLIAISPVALACYTLPNTKKLFDKWFDLFKKLLLVYPICGLLMGGCALASSIILGSATATGDDAAVQNFIYGLVGLIVGVCPFFFIPTIVKNSMAAMGDIGNKLSNFGKRMGSKASGYAGNKLEKSKAFENALNRSHERTNDKLDKIKEEQLNRKAQKKYGKNLNELSADQRKNLLEGSLSAETLAKQREEFAKQKIDRQKGLASAAFANGAGVVDGRINQAWSQAADDAKDASIWSGGGYKIGDKTYVQDENGNLVNTEDPGDIINAEEIGLKIGENINAEELGRRMRQAFGEDGMEQRFGNRNPNITASTYSEMQEKQHAVNRARQLGQLSEFADKDKSTLSHAAIVAGATSTANELDGLLDQDAEYISTITKGKKTYTRGSDNKYHYGDETLSAEEVEEARKNNNIVNAVRRHGEDTFRDAEGRTIDADAVADARVNGGIRTRAQIDRMQSSMSHTGEVFGKSAFAGENASYLETAAAQEAYTGQMGKIKDAKKWNESVVSAVDVDGKQYYYNQRSNSYVDSRGNQATGATLDSINKAIDNNQVKRFTRNENGQFVSASGEILAENAVKNLNLGLSQTQGSLKMAEADKSRASAAGALTGAFAGVAASQISGATRVTAENAGVGQTNQVLGDADTIKINQAQGRNTATTRTAAAQASEVRLEQTMSANAGAELVSEQIRTEFGGDADAQLIGRTETQIQQAIDRGAQVIENQFQDTVAVNKYGEAKVTADVAESRAEARYVAQGTKNYQDQYANATKNDIKVEYENALQELDTAMQLPDGNPQEEDVRKKAIMDARIKLNAAGAAGNKKGISDNMIDYVVTNAPSPDTLSSAGGEYYQALVESGEPLLAGIGKEQLKQQNTSQRVDVATFIRNGGLEKMVNEKGTKLTSQFTEETFKALNEIADPQLAEKAAKAIKPSYLVDAAIQDKGNGKKETEIIKMLKTQQNNGGSPVSITLDQLGKLSEGFAEALFQKGLIDQNGQNDLIADATKAENAPKVAALPKSIRTILGV